MAWDRRTLAALAICSTTQVLLLACNGSEFASSDNESGNSGGSASTAGGKGAADGGKATGGTGSASGAGGKGGSSTAGSASGGATTGGQTNPGGAGEPDPGAGGEGTLPNPGFQPPAEGLLYWFSADFGVPPQGEYVTTWKNRANNGGN